MMHVANLEVGQSFSAFRQLLKYQILMIPTSQILTLPPTKKKTQKAPSEQREAYDNRNMHPFDVLSSQAYKASWGRWSFVIPRQPWTGLIHLYHSFN